MGASGSSCPRTYIQLGAAHIVVGSELINSASAGAVDHVFAGTGEVNGTSSRWRWVR
jgi:hypothetical protein